MKFCKYHGKGMEYWSNGDKKYEGGFLEGRRHGKGIEYNEKCQLQGEWVHGLEYGPKTQKVKL